MRRALAIVAGFDLAIIVLCLGSGNVVWLLNTQVGFVTSALVILGSFWGYQRMVKTRVDGGEVPYQKDTLDKIEDPYELYDEEQAQQDRDFKEVIKEEKQKLKENKRSLMQVIRDSRASLSIYRLGSYLLLFIGFMILNNKELLHAQSYLFGVVTAPLVMMAGSYFARQQEG
ncbi:MAG: hypothetical protein ACQESH_01985 [Campylobacterota bacterium]